MREEQPSKEEKPLLIRSFTQAFDLQFFGESTKAMIFDWVTLALLVEIIVILIGKIYPISVLYQWTYRENWYFVQHVIIPIFIPFMILTLVKRDGVSFWRFVTIWISDWFSQDHFEPFQEKHWYEWWRNNL